MKRVHLSTLFLKGGINLFYKINKWVKNVKDKREVKKNAEIQKQIRDEEEYKRKLVELSEEVTYENLVRNPDTYHNKPIKITVEISHISRSTIFYDTSYIGVKNGNLFMFEYDYEENPRILKNDTVTFYGFFDGLTETFNMKLEKYEVPKILTKHHLFH